CIMKRSIFVSSVEKELKDARLTVRDVVNTTPSLSAHFEPVLYELLPTATHVVLSGALKALDTCQVYLLIVGAEYGTVVNGLSITHHEYHHARKNTAMPKLVFVLGDKNMSRDPGTHVLLD